jgi:hypothetical protein
MTVKTFYTNRGEGFIPVRCLTTDLDSVILFEDKVFDSQVRKNLEHKGFAN